MYCYYHYFIDLDNLDLKFSLLRFNLTGFLELLRSSFMSYYLRHYDSPFFHYFIDSLNILIIPWLFSHEFLKCHYYKLVKNLDYRISKKYCDLFRRYLDLASNSKIVDYCIAGMD